MKKAGLIFVLVVVVGMVLFFLYGRKAPVILPGELIPLESVAYMSIADISDVVKKADGLIEAMGIPKGGKSVFSDLVTSGMKVAEDINNPEDLSRYGLDPEGELCLIWPDPKFANCSLIAQIKDRDLAVKTIQEKIPNATEKNYRRIQYWVAEKATCGIVSSCLVISKEEEDFLTIAKLSTREGEALRPEIPAGSELAFYMNLVKIFPEIKLKVDGAMPFIKMIGSQMAAQSKGRTAGASLIAAMLELEVSGALALLDGLNNLSLSLDLDNEEAKVTTSIRCKDDSTLRNYLVSQPGSFRFLGYLPEDAPMVMGFRYDAELGRSAINECLSKIVDFLNTRPELTEGEAIKEFVETWKQYAAYQGSEYVFAWLANPETFLNFLYIIEVTDGQSALAAYTDLEVYNRMALPWLTPPGGDAPANLYQAEPSEMHQGIEIKHIALKGYRDAIAGMMGTAQEEMLSFYPQDIHMWFACKDDILIYSMSEDAASVKSALDRILEGKMVTEVIYQDQNILLRMSILGMAKNFVPMFSKMPGFSPLTMINWKDVRPQSWITATGVLHEGELQYELIIPAQAVEELINLGQGKVEEQ